MWLRDSIAPPSALSVVVDTYIHEYEPNLVGLCVIARVLLRDSIAPPSALSLLVDT